MRSATPSSAARARTASAYGVNGPAEITRSAGTAGKASTSASRFLRASTVPVTSANGASSGRRTIPPKRRSTPGCTTSIRASRSMSARYSPALNCESQTTAAAVVCDSQFSAGEYRALIDRDARIEVVHPGVDLRFGGIVRRPDEAPFALVTGTVEARKNLLALVDALPAVPALRVISAGPFTPYADAVRARAAELGVADRIELRGFVTQAELDDLYARAACALVPSRYEGFGYALAEALCAGLPAIASRSSSLIEVAGDDG